MRLSRLWSGVQTESCIKMSNKVIGDPGRFMLLILTIIQAETPFGCWPEKAQQRVESLVGVSGNTHTSGDFKSCFVQ